MHMAGTDLGHSRMSSKNYRNYSASSLALFKTINSDFIMEQTMQYYLDDFLDTTVPLRVKIYPLIDFDSSEFAIQFTSLYP